MAWFFVSVVVFMAGHIIPGVLRRPITARIGSRAYIAAFSVVSLFLLGWVIYEVQHADFIALWPYEIWQSHVTLTFMLPACILWAAAILQPCPLSIGRKIGFDLDHPGINRFTRHPLLLGMMLWGLGHILPNGDLVAFMFFGGSVIFAIAGFARMEKIRAKHMDEAEYKAILAGTRRFDLAGIVHGAFGWRDVMLGIVLYGAILWAHPYVIGVDPLGAMGG
ncbi:NnrU family protein [Thalassospira alkalitolerans]|uniref:NnrU family protein n=1 Tax=Thalassospira alkalitolerans TaxID=1293890 RepID=A0A1Y2LBK5_9PROT|nr:NnrU family protein [Thalassospira alkalitolerans]OSQ46716.1 NnrU family protein [Thalassospira alkalitolerans]